MYLDFKLARCKQFGIFIYKNIIALTIILPTPRHALDQRDPTLLYDPISLVRQLSIRGILANKEHFYSFSISNHTYIADNNDFRSKWAFRLCALRDGCCSQNLNRFANCSRQQFSWLLQTQIRLFHQKYQTTYLIDDIECYSFLSLLSIHVRNGRWLARNSLTSLSSTTRPPSSGVLVKTNMAVQAIISSGVAPNHTTFYWIFCWSDRLGDGPEAAWHPEEGCSAIHQCSMCAMSKHKCEKYIFLWNNMLL